MDKQQQMSSLSSSFAFSHWHPFPLVENKPLLLPKFSNDEQSRVFTQLMSHMETTILYSLTGHTPFMMASEPLCGFIVTNPKKTMPEGCVMRFFAYVDNPGSSMCQVELRQSADGAEYDFYISSAKNGDMLFTGDKFVFEHRVFLLFSIVKRMYQLCPPEKGPLDPGKSSFENFRANFETFCNHTRVQSFEPKHWTHFDALLHHVIFKSSHVKRKREKLEDWILSYDSGDYLTVNGVDYVYSIRAAIHDFMDGTRHSRRCPSSKCQFCVRHGLEHFCSPDVCTTILSYYYYYYYKFEALD